MVKVVIFYYYYKTVTGKLNYDSDHQFLPKEKKKQVLWWSVWRRAQCTTFPKYVIFQINHNFFIYLCISKRQTFKCNHINNVNYIQTDNKTFKHQY